MHSINVKFSYYSIFPLDQDANFFKPIPKKKDDAGDTVDTTMEVSTMSPSPAAVRTRVGDVATNLETRDGMDSIVALAIRNKSKQNNK